MAKTTKKSKETKVICPVCGSEVAIGDHEHKVKNATVIGADSCLGTIELPISKRGQMLQAAGVDTTKYFSIQVPGGGEQWMVKTENGGAVPVTADDPVIAKILSQGTVPNRSLFRRWIMSQVFHGLLCDGGFIKWVHNHGYQYQWKMVIEELRVQAEHLYGKDMENFRARNRWFNQDLAVAMADDFCDQLRAEAKAAKVRHCKGVPYVTIGYKDYFVDDIEKKLIGQLSSYIWSISNATTPQDLYEAVRDFWYKARNLSTMTCYKQCQCWVDAYKGMGAYATMQNLLRFHGCTFPMNSEFYRSGLSDLAMLELAAKTYEHGEGWRLFGLMKLMMQTNHVDIKAKQAQWAASKKARKALKAAQAES